ncbi:hypothetical protein IFM89_037326 [Coptis chinensis]|uniref:RNase H type-1 domain-containing protein n=1 Tax=Coptis chinensis TaxID=261450 RepID=A0A835LSW8_9MAGN|nr:hypothetical protein IFM89_037326 [Coptis chinensis]
MSDDGANNKQKQEPELIKKKEEVEKLPPPPEKPLPGDCCGSGCGINRLIRLYFGISSVSTYFEEMDADDIVVVLKSNSGPSAQETHSTNVDGPFYLDQQHREMERVTEAECMAIIEGGVEQAFTRGWKKLWIKTDSEAAARA